MEKLLRILNENARMSEEKIATMLSVDVEEVRSAIRQYEADGVIRGYKALIDWEKAGREYVTAHIELKVTPKRDHGFDDIARRILQFPEVESVYLMSGGYDLSVMVSGRTFQEVAMFVARRLSTLESVMATTTHFVLRKYKDAGIDFCDVVKDERGHVSP